MTALPARVSAAANTIAKVVDTPRTGPARADPIGTPAKFRADRDGEGASEPRPGGPALAQREGADTGRRVCATGDRDTDRDHRDRGHEQRQDSDSP